MVRYELTWANVAVLLTEGTNYMRVTMKINISMQNQAMANIRLCQLRLCDTIRSIEEWLH